MIVGGNHFIVGTGTSVGKNVIVCSLLSLSRRMGRESSPFKPFAIDIGPFRRAGTKNNWTPSISHQSHSAGVEPHARMNPIRIMYPSPNSIPVLWVLGEKTALPGTRERVQSLFDQAITEALSRYSPDATIVAEGSGSVTDGLSRDLVHSFTAEKLNAAVHIVADAGLGGAYAQLIGTLELMPLTLRKRVRSLIINRMDGPLDNQLLEEFRTFVSSRYAIDIVETIPTLFGVQRLDEKFHPQKNAIPALLDEIDSVADQVAAAAPRLVSIALDSPKCLSAMA